MQKDVLGMEKHLREEVIHHQPVTAPLTANQMTKRQCFLPKVMHDMKLKAACCLRHHIHCPPTTSAPQQILPLLKQQCLTPQATWSAMKHIVCCNHFSIGCETSSSLQHPVIAQQFQSQDPEVGV